MHSEDETANPDSQQLIPLRREVPITERQRITVLAGLLSLAGVALGFGLGQYASAGSADNHCEHRVVVRSAPAAAPSATATYAQASRLTWLGVEVESRRNLPGALVVAVVPGSPAERAGLVKGQRIVELGGVPIARSRDVVQEVRFHSPGDAIVIVTRSLNGFDDAPAQTHNAVLGAISRREMLKLQR